MAIATPMTRAIRSVCTGSVAFTMAASPHNLAQPRGVQEPASHLYVVKAVGDWVVHGDSGPLSLRSLTHVPIRARVGVRSTARIDTTFTLVLRDPRSLRTASWSCKPVARCRGDRQASQLTFTSNAIPVSPRTGALFVNLGNGAEGPRRVQLVGARGNSQDWGLIVFVSDSGWLDIEPITSRLGSDRANVVLRICSLASDASSRVSECMNARQVRTEDCVLDTNARCRVQVGRHEATPVAVTVFVREASTLPNSPIAGAVGMVTSRQHERAITDLTRDYWRDLLGIRDHVTDDEFRALTVAAALEIARSRS